VDQEEDSEKKENDNKRIFKVSSSLSVQRKEEEKYHKFEAEKRIDSNETLSRSIVLIEAR